MNPIITVRIPAQLQETALNYAKTEGYTNMQDLVRTLIREYTLEKKREQLLEVWGTQKAQKISRAKMREMVASQFA